MSNLLHLPSYVSRLFYLIYNLMKIQGMSKKIFIEIITLDSSAYSPCQYMVEMVKKVVPFFPDRIEWKESLIKTREGMQRNK